MVAPESTGDHVEKHRGVPAFRKAELITIFVNEYGENATWEDWCAFLENYKAKGFEWTDDVT